MKTNRSNKMTKVMASALAAIMMMTTASSLAASANQTFLYDVTHMNSQSALKENDATSDLIKKNAVKLGMTAIEKFVPGGKAISPVVGKILVACGVMPKETTLDDINKNITQMREEINDQLATIKKDIGKNTKDILDALKNETYISGFGTEMDKLHEAAQGIGKQIDSFRNNENLSEEEKAVEIAALIGNNTKWNSDGDFVFRMKTIGNTLAGKTFSDMKGRDLYQIVYENEIKNVMFSGEAYDKIAPYIDKVMLEYFYAYSVMAQCFEAADQVAQFTPEQIEGLSAQASHKYYQSVSRKCVIDDEIQNISDKIFNAERNDSVITAYSVFKFKKDNQRNVFVDKGNDEIVISKDVKENTVRYGVVKTSDINKDCLNKANSIINKALSENAIKGSKVKELSVYVDQTYPGMSFDKFLEYVGIDTSNFKDSTTKMFAAGNSAVTDDYFENGNKIFTVGFDTFCHRLSDEESRNYYYQYMRGELTLAEYKELTKGEAVCTVNTHNLIRTEYTSCIGYNSYTYYTYSLREYNNVILTFQQGTLDAAPETAAEII